MPETPKNCVDVLLVYVAIPTVKPAPTYNSPSSGNPSVESTVITVVPIETGLIKDEDPVGSNVPTIDPLLKLTI